MASSRRFRGTAAGKLKESLLLKVNSPDSKIDDAEGPDVREGAGGSGDLVNALGAGKLASPCMLIPIPFRARRASEGERWIGF
jgi:hypothetical protein